MPRTTDRAVRAITRFAPAKVNLFLELRAKRPDGFHSIETLMVAVSLADTLTVMLADSLTLSCTDPALPTGEGNLVVKAANALRHRTGYTGGASIHLHKRIPAAAGLAGGSSDAAATLVALDTLWCTNLPANELAATAAEVGSDVAFFLDLPSAWCTGRGEIVEPVRPVKRLHLVLVCPPVGLSTADVYRNATIPNAPRSSNAMRTAYASGDDVGIGRELFNRLQEPAERLSPIVRDMREAVARHAPLGCLMSGSGSTLFALCPDHRAAVRLAAVLRTEFASDPKPRVFVVRSLIPERTSPAN
jgi:4-diphosphocytidyl-2-C-methyl-D-erythritol kinase